MAHDGLGLYYCNRNRFNLVVMDKYEKALEQARNYYPDNLFLDTIFPELAESEDERLRKELIRLLSKMTDGIIENYTPIPLRDFIAYPAEWSEEDERKFLEIRCLIGNYRTGNDEYELYSWIDKIKDRVQPQPKQEWSEEDKNMLNSIIATCQLAAQDRDSGPARHLLGMQERFLKSLRPQPHWKPSEEQPEVDLEKEYQTWWNSISGKINVEHIMEWYMHETARHFYELGLNARKEE